MEQGTKDCIKDSRKFGLDFIKVSPDRLNPNNRMSLKMTPMTVLMTNRSMMMTMTS
jgi:hypothetical protein